MSIAIKWDRAPVRQSFGACNVVFDGVATGPDVTPVDNGQGYGLLSALMQLKGESPETIARVLGGL